MTAATLSPGAASPATAPASSYRLSFGHILRSEWIKFRTLRSTLWTVSITVVVMVGIALMFAGGITSFDDGSSGTSGDGGGAGAGAMIVTFGYQFAQLVIAVLGALTITGEYSTGMIRSTLSAVPTRTPALVAKTLVVTLVTVVISVIGVALSYVATLPILAGTRYELDLSADGVVRSLIAVPLYLALIAVIAVSFGALIRNSAGAIFSLVALLLVIPSILPQIPVQWLRDLSEYLPSIAGGRLISGAGPDMPPGLGEWQGFTVMAIWAVVLWIFAAVMIKRRDA